MRDPNRIKPILAAIQAQWEKCPDLRLGQLVYNAISKGSEDRLPPFPELFYAEDDVLLRGLTNES